MDAHVRAYFDFHFRRLEWLVESTARRFARLRRQDPAECVADAGLHFLEAIRGFDPSRGTMEARVVWVVWNRLADDWRRRLRLSLRLPIHSGGPEGFRGLMPAALAEMTAPEDSVPLAHFGDDARVVIAILSGCSADLLSAARACGRGVFAARKLVREHLRGAGWENTRFRRAWAEIGQMV